MNSLQLLQFILSFATQATLITAATCAIERRCESARTKAQVWTCYYLCLLALLAAGLLLPKVNLPSPWLGLSGHEVLRAVTVQETAAVFLLATWFAGVVVFAARWLIAFALLHCFLRRCPLVGDAEKLRFRDAVSAKLSTLDGREVDFRIGPEAFGPFCYQFHTPVIVLPPSVVSGDLEELRQVLQHELTHLQTRHPLQLFFQRTVQTLLWFIPTVWTAGRRASLAREFVCDEAAVGGGASTVNYLKTLLRFAYGQNEYGRTILAMARSTSELTVRAQRLATRRSSNTGRQSVWAQSFVVLISLGMSQLWLPTNPLDSPKANYSPWPTWSAAVLHTFNISARDFDKFDARLQVHDLTQESSAAEW
ncbi:MAG: M56 family metallopeptidase [Planctomycetaceae bacterium]|nr:M56 family metallopeptidase [Planctomycetaceae bacterium]